MDRRDTLLGLIALGAAPLAAFAQQSGKAWRIGILSSATPRSFATRIEALRAELRKLGYEEGRNLVLESRWSDGKDELLPEFAAELVRLNVDLVVTHGTIPLRAIRNATTSVPIVFATSFDVVALGFVASLGRPGGNITGSIFFAAELAAKRIELLKETLPGTTQVAELAELDNRARPLYHQTMEATARSAKVALHEFAVRGAHELDSAFSRMAKQRVTAVVVPDYPVFGANAGAIADLAARHRLASAGSPDFAQAGGLIGYGADYVNMWRRAAHFADRIFKGTKPAEIPVEQATRFELALNQKTARTLGLKVPSSLLARADRVIE